MSNQEILLQMAKDFDVDFENGIVYWINSRVNKRHAGSYKSKLNRVYITYKNKQYLRYRIVFALYHGYWPFGEIDHIDGNSSNDSISNLRDVSRRINSKNCKLRKDNKYGIPGISFHQNKWRVRIAKKHVLSFDNFDDAFLFRKNKQLEFGYTERHGT